ncbi:membrane protein insertase YidC [Pacificimonas flava]|uniref:Membrane protein insertase YidC n=1 Tax=Pacificimonas flava TaxID=1234595 RepID=M2TM43_9SPHN|nr:membrane protein insertase YidC [Pacificimonas flava]EMD82806.1 Inner membrane protein translocase component YidC, long form [Pacificimonas flava]MBB5279422.1 YidC/Oxa1 family membrane protein insertase [Pacificimonas flava]
MSNENKNLLIAMVLSMAVLFGWTLISETFFPTSQEPSSTFVDGQQVALPDDEAGPGTDSVPAIRERTEVLVETPRVMIDAPALSGSINLTGARIDDLLLKRHHETLAADSDIRLFSPRGAPDAYFAQIGWTGEGDLPGQDTRWQASAETLTADSPLTLSWTNDAGVRFLIEIAVDDNYLFTVRQRIENRGTSAVVARPYGLIAREGTGPNQDSWTAHVGPISSSGGETNYDLGYDDLVDEGGRASADANDGWLGFTDTYWLSALIAPEGQSVNSAFRTGRTSDSFEATMQGEPLAVAPNSAQTSSLRIYAGAKEIGVLENYDDKVGINGLEGAVDWGWFRVIAKPIYHLLSWLYGFAGNFGVAIILLVVIIRIVLFPIANKQYESMAKMRRLQPKMKALQERHKDDKQRLQQEMMKLYREEKANPIAGCLPMLLQIPIFYALYKTLLLSIDIRHKPFVLWIKDLSAPDPLTPVNLFGFLPFDPPGFLAIGVLPILLGITMWLTMRMNPTPMDEVQKKVFGIMPWVFMFIMAPFAAGLQLYWTINNIFSIGQQWILLKKYPREPEPEAAKAK